ncbi:RNA-binding protein [bacterium]|nr:RNA-binding protein [bacterium]
MKLYVSNLSFATSEETLRSAFVPYGTVLSVRVVTHEESGKSRGYAFVDMASADEGQSAVAALNGKSLGGRTLKISVALPSSDASQGA